MDKGLQEIGVRENQLMKEDFETTHYSSAGSGEQPRVRPLSEMAFRRETQKTSVKRLYPGFQNLKKDLDHPNSMRRTIEIGWRHLCRGTKAKKMEIEEPGTQFKIPVGKDRVKKSPKTGTQQLYPAGFENLKKTVEQPNRVRSKNGGTKRSLNLFSRNNKILERNDRVKQGEVNH